MKIKAITKTHCPKCEWAKNRLKHYPVEWFNFDTDEEARELAKKYNLNAVPVFLIFQDDETIITTQSALYVRKHIDGNI